MIPLRICALLAAWVCAGLSLSAAELRVPHIEVYKAKRTLLLFEGTSLVRTYHVALGSNPVAPKQRQGDRATPEGRYFICQKNPASRFHLSLAINYPNKADAERGLKAGLISRKEYAAIVQAGKSHKIPPWDTALGGTVFMHGGGSASDWTWGCIALDNTDIEELYGLVPVHTPVTIYP